jgi:YjbE family integral membrane protein
MESIGLDTGSGFLSALIAIALLNLVLSGDNAIVIGLAARNVPAHLQKRVIGWGILGAIVVRTLLTFVVVWLLKIPGFMLAGGLALVYIAWKLTLQNEGDGPKVDAKTSVGAAVSTIIVADVVMGADNVLAIGGAAQGSLLLVVLGLLLSVPIVVWGSQMILKLVDRYPGIVILGAGMLGWTAAKMIASDALLEHVFADSPTGTLALNIVFTLAAVAPGLWHVASPRQREIGGLLAFLLVWWGVFELIEDAMGWESPAAQDWQWWFESTDFAKHVGWIPVALWLQRRLATGRSKLSARP